MNLKRNTSDMWDSVIPMPKLNMISSFAVICIAAFICFSNSLNGAFVFDDHEAVINNKDVTSIDVTLSDIFVHDFWGTSISHAASHKSYRPLTILSFRLLYRISGQKLDPYVFHCFNLLLHMIVSCLTFIVYNILFEMRCPKSSFFCALLFAIHPVHAESVVGIVGQAELLSAFFALLSFITYHFGCAFKRSLFSTLIYTLGSCIFSVIAMLCKEQGITIIGVISIYDVVVVNKMTLERILEIASRSKKMLSFGNLKHFSKNFYHELFEHGVEKYNGLKNITRSSAVKNSYFNYSSNTSPLVAMIFRHMILLTVTGIALYARWLLMGSKLPTFQKTDNPASFEESFFIRILNYNYIYLINIWILLCPEWLCFDWSMGCIPLIKLNSTVFDYRIIFVVVFWLILCALLYSVYKSKGVIQRTLITGFSSMFILFSPASNIFFKVGFVIAERVLYLPSFGYFLIIVVGLQRLASRRYLSKVTRLSTIFLITFFMIRSIHRTGDWLNERKLFESALSVCPLNAKVHYNLAKNAADRGFKKFAISHYEEALRLHPRYDLAMNNLANIYRDEGNFDVAEKLLIKALEIRPDFSTAWMNLGIVYSSKGSLNESEFCYLEALKHRKKYPDCYYNLGNLYLELGRNCEALAAWRNATKLKPTHKIAWSNLIVMLDSLGRLKEAVNESYNALLYLPNESNIHFNLANVLGKLNEYEESEKHFLKAISLNHQQSAYLYNLGVLYHRWNKFCKAKYYYSEAYRLDPSSKAKQQLNSLNKLGKFIDCTAN